MKNKALEALDSLIGRAPTSPQAQLTSIVEIITPELAKKYLETNLENQRNISHGYLSTLRRQVKLEQWQLTGQPIIFDSNGKLIDGQHRLMALIYENKTVPFLVVRGAPPRSFMVIDTGKSRTKGNILAIKKVPNYNAVAASVLGVLNYRRALTIVSKHGENNEKTRHGSFAQLTMTSTEIVNEYEAHSSAYDEVAHIAIKMRKTIQPSVVGTVIALSAIDAGHDFNVISSFWNNYYKGVGLTETNPALLLRNKINTNDKSKAKLRQPNLILLCVKAWNLYITGKSSKILKIADGEGVVPVL
jgi:hypothetical protein